MQVSVLTAPSSLRGSSPQIRRARGKEAPAAQVWPPRPRFSCSMGQLDGRGAPEAQGSGYQGAGVQELGVWDSSPGRDRRRCKVRVHAACRAGDA